MLLHPRRHSVGARVLFALGTLVVLNVLQLYGMVDVKEEVLAKGIRTSEWVMPSHVWSVTESRVSDVDVLQTR